MMADLLFRRAGLLRRLCRVVLVMAVAAAVAAPLSACGKRGANMPPDDGDYPRQYPSR